MTSGSHLDLRPPPLATVLWLVSLVVAAGTVVLVSSSGADTEFRIFFVVFVVGICVYTARARSRATTAEDGSLVVRNVFSTRTLRPADIDRVFQGRQGGFGSVRRVELLLTDGSTLQLLATDTLPLPGSQDRLADQADQVRMWATSAPGAA